MTVYSYMYTLRKTDTFFYLSQEPIDRLYRLIGGKENAGWQVSPELDQLFRAMVHKDPMARPSAVEILRCDWIQNANEVTEAEVVAAFERRRPVSEEAHNTMSVTCAPRLKNTEHAFDALMVRVSQSPNPASAIDHTRIRRDYYDQKGLFPIPRTMEYSIPFPIPHTNPGYTHHDRLTLSFLHSGCGSRPTRARLSRLGFWKTRSR